MGRFDPGAALVLINRREYWQMGYVIPKGAADKVRAAGLPAFRTMLARLLPWIGARVAELADWEQVKLLTVQIDCLRKWWRPGLLCIGDAAHAMSPVGGVGINIAIQDAVAAGNYLAGGDFSPANLSRIQGRRRWPARCCWLQIAAQDRIIARVLNSRSFGNSVVLPPAGTLSVVAPAAGPSDWNGCSARTHCCIATGINNVSELALDARQCIISRE